MWVAPWERSCRRSSEHVSQFPDTRLPRRVLGSDDIGFDHLRLFWEVEGGGDELKIDAKSFSEGLHRCAPVEAVALMRATEV